MAGPALTVVIPTRNRRSTLALTLDALERQEIPSGSFEVVVVDDGSPDDTSVWLARQTFGAFEFKTLKTEGIGPAGARNLGISQAQAQRVLLLGDDTIPLPSTLAEHLALAGDDEIGVQGRIDWDPMLEITPVMEFLAPEGPQFWFKGLTDGSPVPFTGVYGSNLSAPTRWFLEEPFDETYRSACFEDTEQAWRWSRRGWHVVFGDRAVCRHRHHYDTLEPFLQRQRAAGAATRRLVTGNPVLAWSLILRPLLVGAALAAKTAVGRTSSAESMNLQCRGAFVSGLVGLGERGTL
ncbi:MAG: glycosyltransferase [Acidobacteriota bacterium]